MDRMDKTDRMDRIDRMDRTDIDVTARSDPRPDDW